MNAARHKRRPQGEERTVIILLSTYQNNRDNIRRFLGACGLMVEGKQEQLSCDGHLVVCLRISGAPNAIGTFRGAYEYRDAQ